MGLDCIFYIYVLDVIVRIQRLDTSNMPFQLLVVHFNDQFQTLNIGFVNFQKSNVINTIDHKRLHFDYHFLKRIVILSMTHTW